MRTPAYLTILCLATAALFSLEKATAQTDLNNYYGQSQVPLDGKTKSPKQAMPDAFGSEVFIGGDFTAALDSRSLAAQEMENQENRKNVRREIDRSIRADIASGQPVTVLIAPEHFTQVTFLKDGEIVYPRRAFAGQPDLLIIDKKENSPYVYIAATGMFEGQTTNLFVETEEDGKVQTYVLNLLVTEPKNIREQVSVNLVDDRTPSIRGFGPGGNPTGPQSTGTTGATAQSGRPTQGGVVSGKFGDREVKTYMNTMIEMANHYQEAKNVEKKGGPSIYKDTEIKPYPSGQFTYVDPVEGTQWNVNQIWFFPKYDAILLDVRCKNPNKTTSMWDFSQVRWQPNQSPVFFPSTAAAPLSMQTLPGRTNQIWYLIQGNRIDPRAEFTPVFPRADRRGSGTVRPAQSIAPDTK